MIEIEQVRRFLIGGFLTGICIMFCCWNCCAQVTIEGNLQDQITGESLIGASVIMKGTTIGTVTDFDGNFVLDVPRDPPFTLVFSYIGFNTQEKEITNASEKLKISLEEQSFTIGEVQIIQSRISEKVKESPQTIEAMDIIAIKETPSANFYDGLGNLKGVDLTTASLGFTIINTRGFNSTSPVRSLQTIDGVDNQAPGLNFSLGNFLGSPELDVQKVELVVGANSAYYGPNAFNGVIAMVTKDPFIHQGLSLQFKAGERGLLDGGFRYAKAFGSEKGKEKFAFKVNFNYMQANDWEAENYDEVYRENAEDYLGVTNPGGYDAVNIYGDEHVGRQSFAFDHTSPALQINFPGLGVVHRRGYKEIDLVDYGTQNLKMGAALHYKIQDDVQVIGSMLYGTGTTVYQGENRLSLRGIKFYQPKLEISKRNKWFLRGYYTQEDDGDTFDSYFTASKLVNAASDGVEWIKNYRNFWRGTAPSSAMWDNDFEEEVENFPGWAEAAAPGAFDIDAANTVLANHQAELTSFHAETQAFTNSYADGGAGVVPFYEPGTARFDSLFNLITTSTERNPAEGELGGTGFYDESALWHVHGEYKFNPTFGDITVGGNFRQFRPDSRGTIFNDTASLITNNEFGSYIGLEKKVLDKRLKLSASMRADKNQNFDLLFSPAISGVYTLTEKTIVRISFSSAIRNPTLTDQYFFYDVGPAILLGNKDGVEDLVTTESFLTFLGEGGTPLDLEYFNIDPIQPEKVLSGELGVRSTIGTQVYLDASYYLNSYTDFIGYRVGADVSLIGSNFTDVQFYRVATNSDQRVFSQGFSLGLNYYFGQYYSLNGNYSWNQLTTQVDDPIIPAFNTPEHKFNIGVNARNMIVNLGDKKLRGIGFNVNYKWVEGFLFEGSPQFTGEIPTYALLDGQVNYKVPRINSTFKIGATNLLNNKVIQVYGGPAVGRLAYASVSVDLK